MIIVETGKFTNFEEYLNSLSPSAQKNYRYAKKHNEKVSYSRYVPNLNDIQFWMNLWSQQLIRGQKRTWAFQATELEGKTLVFFQATENRKHIAAQFAEITDEYMNCHPVMYEKEKYAHRYLSKWMWFNLLSWAIENKIGVVDLGGGNDNSWIEMIKTREQYPNPAYKWMYVPKPVKENPDHQQNYKVEHYGISKRISKID